MDIFTFLIAAQTHQISFKSDSRNVRHIEIFSTAGDIRVWLLLLLLFLLCFIFIFFFFFFFFLVGGQSAGPIIDIHERTALQFSRTTI